MNKTAVEIIISIAVVATSSFGAAIPVPGTSNLWLAGAANGTTAMYTDKAPDQSPVEVKVSPGATVSITATGSVNNGPFPPELDPNGGNLIHHSGENNVLPLIAPINSLVGVFLPSDVGTLEEPTSPNESPDLPRPALWQPFFIGSSMKVEAPPGATRLFLGSMDGYDWNNNSGSFSVVLSIVPASRIKLTDERDGSFVTQDGKAFITPAAPPEMPMLQAAIDVPADVTVSWRLRIVFTRPNGAPPLEGDVLNLAVTTEGGVWDIYKSFAGKILGGAATLTCSVGSENPEILRFSILGKNPDPASVLGYADSRVTRDRAGIPTEAWQDAFRRILRQESEEHALFQFYKAGHPKEGQPVVSAKDSGVGISQFTKNSKGTIHSVIDADFFWVWTKNVNAGWAKLSSTVNTIRNYPKDLRMNNSYRSIIESIVNPVRVARKLKPIDGCPAPDFTKAGLLHAEPPNQFLHDAVRSYNGFGGEFTLANTPIVYNGKEKNANGEMVAKRVLLHEYIPNLVFLSEVPDAELSQLESDPRVWIQVPSDRRGTSGEPDYVEKVKGQPAE